MNQSTRLLQAIGSLKKLMHRHEPLMSIPKSEFIVLKMIKEQDDLVKMSDISNALSISNAAVSQLISSLEEKELVKREMASKDRRIIYVSLTNKSKKIIEETSKKLEGFMESLVQNLGESDSEELIRIISKLKTVLEKGDVCREINN